MEQGRPTDYKEEYDDLAYNYCLLGAKDKELAKFFDVTEQTINNWKKARPSFFESLKKGKALADARVADSLFNRAIGYTHPEEKVFNNQGKIVTYKTTKHYAPDPTSAIFWLKNRQPELWRDKQHIETKDVTEEATDEELNKKIEELLKGNESSKDE